MKAFPSMESMLDKQMGMDLRDYFAAKAMQTLISIVHRELTEDDWDEEMFGWDDGKPTTTCFSVADQAYAIAEGMLAVREVTK